MAWTYVISNLNNLTQQNSLFEISMVCALCCKDIIGSENQRLWLRLNSFANKFIENKKFNIMMKTK